MSERDYKDMRISTNNRYLWLMRLVGYIVDLHAGTAKRVTELYEYLKPFSRRTVRDHRGSTLQTDLSVEWRTGKKQVIAHTWSEVSLKSVSNDGRYVLAYCRRLGGESLQVFIAHSGIETTVRLPEMDTIRMLGAVRIWSA